MRHISKIIHFSDIHIKPDRRHDELMEAIQAMLSMTEPAGESNESNGVIYVLAGDVFQSKDRVTPSMLWTCRRMLELISARSPLILINGNHDLYEGRTERIPLLRCLVRGLSNIYYVEASSSFLIDGIGFGVSSLYDGHMIRSDEVEGRQKIAVAHVCLEQVGGHGMARCAKLSDFEGFDVALLGDIHKPMIIGNCAYSGSLIAHNHGEEAEQRGFGIWHIDEGRYEHVPIPSSYGHLSIHVGEDGSIPPIERPLKPYLYIRMILPSSPLPRGITSSSLEEAIRRDISPSVAREFSSVSVSSSRTQAAPVSRPIHGGISMPPSRPDLIELHSSIGEGIDGGIEPRDWAIESIEFLNMFAFKDGTIHHIPFGSPASIRRIAGSNATGKTSILKVVLYALLGTLDVGYDQGRSFSHRGICMINTSCKSGYTSICLRVGEHDRYRITRTQEKKASLINKTKLERWADGSWDDISSGIDKRSIDAEIGRLIYRSISIFMMSNIYSAGLGTSISLLSPRERYSTLISAMSLHIFPSLRDEAKARLREAMDRVRLLEGDVSKLRGKVEGNRDSISLHQPEDEEKMKMALRILKGDVKSMEAEAKALQRRMESRERDLVRVRFGWDRAPDGEESSDIPRELAEIAEAMDSLKRLIPLDISHMEGREGDGEWEASLDELRDLDLMLGNLSIPMQAEGWMEEDPIHAKSLLSSYDDVAVYGGEMPSSSDLSLIQEKMALYERVDTGDLSLDMAREELTKYGIYWREDTPCVVVPYAPAPSPPRSRMMIEQEYMEAVSSPARADAPPSVLSFFGLPSIKPARVDTSTARAVIDIIYEVASSPSMAERLALSCSFRRSQTREEDMAMYMYVNYLISVAHRLSIESKRNMVRGIEKRRLVCIVRYHELSLKRRQHNNLIIRRLRDLQQRRERLERWKDYKGFLSNLIVQAELEEMRAELEQKEALLSAARDRVIDISHRVGKASGISVLREMGSICSNKLEEMERELETARGRASLIEEYAELVDPKGGIAQSLIREKLEEMRAFINDLLIEYTRYSVSFSISEKGLDIALSNGSGSLSLQHLSGFELFMFEMAFKLALSLFNPQTRARFFAIDEGLDVIDTENMDKMGPLFERMRSIYGDIILITHRAGIDQYCDCIIDPM